MFRKLSKEFDCLFDYDNDKTLNKILIDKIKRLCESNIMIDDISRRIDTLKTFKQFTICKEYYKSKKIRQGFNLLFLEYERNRIFLNYIKDTEEFKPVEKYYIPNDPEIEDYSKEIELFGKKYLIINTFDSFIKYSELNELPLSKDNNSDFFYYLGRALNYDNKLIENGTINSIEYLWFIYKYIVIDDVILIIDYDCLADL